MKKYGKLTVLLAVICLGCFLSACDSTERDAENSRVSQLARQETEGMETPLSGPEGEQEGTTADQVLVAYFSATGNTRDAALKIAAATGADIYEIVPAQAYTAEDLDYGNQDSRTSAEMNDPKARPEIEGEALSLEGYHTVYLGYPVWWGDAPRIMSTFVESHDFTGKTVIPFCTSGGSGSKTSESNLKEQAASGNWLAGRRFGAGVSQEEIEKWIGELQEKR